MTNEITEARVRALKVPDPQFLIDRLKGRKEALILSGASHDTLVGEKFILVNEILKKNEPALAFGRISFTQEPKKLKNAKGLGSRAAGVDPIMLREFEEREAPLFVLKLKLLKAFPKPRELSKPPPGRFSSEIEFTEAFHIRNVHWVPVPEDDECPASHPNKLKSPEDESRCYTAAAADALRRSRESEELLDEQKRPSLKAQTYVLSKERFKTKAQANKWMDDNDVPRPKVDETDSSFRYRQFPPDRCQENSQRTSSITDGVQIVGCRVKPEFQERAEEPKSPRGLTVAETFQAMEEKGRKFTREEANFQERSPEPQVACGACRFYLRDGQSEVGLCQVVDGPIPWFATSDLYISATEEATAAFALQGKPKQEEVQEQDLSEKYDGRAGPSVKALKKGRMDLTEDERGVAMKADAVWHHGPKGEETCAIWKSSVNGRVWYACNTHRALNVMPTLKGAIKQFHDFIKGTA